VDKWLFAVQLHAAFINGEWTENLRLHAEIDKLALNEEELRTMSEHDEKILSQSDTSVELVERLHKEKSDSLAEQLTATIERQTELIREQNRIMRGMLLARRK
jgi:hypothetical protein